MTPPTSGHSRPAFRPVAVLSLLYFAAFFLVFGMLLVLPELAAVLDPTRPGPELQQAAEEAVHAVFRPRLPIAALLAVLATGAGIRFKALPGLKS